MKCRWPECEVPALEGKDFCEVHAPAASYQARADETGQELWWRDHRFVPKGGLLPPPEDPTPLLGAKVYKVLTQRDEYFKSKFNPEALEQLLNQHARSGWRVVGMTATDVGSFFGSFWAKGGGATRQELVVLLEKDAS